MSRWNRFFFCGEILAGIEGPGTERFFNIAAQRELELCEIRRDPYTGVTTFRTTADDYRKMKSVARKTGVRLRIREKNGLPFWLYRNRKRKLAAAGLAGFFVLLYVCSLYVWDISFEGNRRFTDEMLLHYMETIPVACGMKKSEISCENLEESLRSRFPEITWASAELKGTRLVVHIRENETILSPEVPDESPCDLSASREGTVVKTVVRSGISQVKAGDQVTEGSLLVSGTIPILDDSGTLVNSHKVRADAEIYAMTAHTYETTLSRTRTEKASTGRTRKGIFFRILDHSFLFLLPAGNGEHWEFFMEQHQLKLSENFYLPVYGSVITAREYIPYEKALTEEEIRRAADEYEREYMEKLGEKGIQIIGNDDKIETDSSGIRITGTVTVVEDIAAAVPIPDQDEENQTVNELN